MQLPNSLLNPNQLHAFGVNVNDNPFEWWPCRCASQRYWLMTLLMILVGTCRGPHSQQWELQGEFSTTVTGGWWTGCHW
jgi:hypothetical protein